MSRKKTDMAQPKAEGAENKKRPGRRPMTLKEKEAAAKQRAADKAKADNLRPEVILQYQDSDTSLVALVDAAKDDFRSTKKRTPITDLKLYVKPEEHIAYYVINDDNKGQISF